MNIKQLAVVTLLTVSSLASASEYTDYLKALEAEAASFNMQNIEKYKFIPDFTTKQGMLEQKLTELEGFWGTFTPLDLKAASRKVTIDATSYLQALAKADAVHSKRTSVLSPKEMTQLRKLENEIVTLLNDIAQWEKK